MQLGALKILPFISLFFPCQYEDDLPTTSTVTTGIYIYIFHLVEALNKAASIKSVYWVSECRQCVTTVKSVYWVSECWQCVTTVKSVYWVSECWQWVTTVKSVCLFVQGVILLFIAKCSFLFLTLHSAYLCLPPPIPSTFLLSLHLSTLPPFHTVVRCDQVGQLLSQQQVCLQCGGCCLVAIATAHLASSKVRPAGECVVVLSSMCCITVIALLD